MLEFHIAARCRSVCRRQAAQAFVWALLAAAAWAFVCGVLRGAEPARDIRQERLNEWRDLTSRADGVPRVFVKGNGVRFYFPSPSGVVFYSASWGRVRVPNRHFMVGSARLERHDSVGDGAVLGWREATVVAGSEWRRLSSNIVSALAPTVSGRLVQYQAFLSDRVFYRDTLGAIHSVAPGHEPPDLPFDHRFSEDETLDVIGRAAEQQLAVTHPGTDLFVLMAPNASRVAHPVLLDRKRRRCVLLNPEQVFLPFEGSLGAVMSPEGMQALFLESHGLALLRNPFSSLARLADLGVETVFRLARLPIPVPAGNVPPIASRPSMDPAQWETWLDDHTGTKSQRGSLKLLIDGDGFFPPFEDALRGASNSIHLLIYIFDRDDVGVHVADILKGRSRDVDVKIILDRLGTIGGGGTPPSTPLPPGFQVPPSILKYLEADSRVEVRPFLNPWFSSQHSKVLIVDGQRAWMGGMNLGREYRYEWHDTMVEITGPVVASLEQEFQRGWAHAGPWGDLAYFAAIAGQSARARPSSVAAECSAALSDGDWKGKVRLLPTRTAWKPFASAVRASFQKAQRRVFVHNPYVFDKRVILDLVRARKNGVDVRVILPQANDFKPGRRGNLVIANYLLQRGVRVYFYPGMSHVKAVLADGWACVGSANLNHLSLRVNQESNLATSDPEFVSSLETELFETDFARSFELKEPISVDWVDFLADLALEGP